VRAHTFVVLSLSFSLVSTSLVSTSLVSTSPSSLPPSSLPPSSLPPSCLLVSTPLVPTSLVPTSLASTSLVSARLYLPLVSTSFCLPPSSTSLVSTSLPPISLVSPSLPRLYLPLHPSLPLIPPPFLVYLPPSSPFPTYLSFSPLLPPSGDGSNILAVSLPSWSCSLVHACGTLIVWRSSPSVT
jgi:hypothetical protein